MKLKLHQRSVLLDSRRLFNVYKKHSPSQKMFLEISQNSQENTCSLRPATLFKKTLWRRWFPVNFAKFLRTAFLQNTSGQLILCIRYSKDTLDIFWHLLTEHLSIEYLRCLQGCFTFFATLLCRRTLVFVRFSLTIWNSVKYGQKPFS